MRRILVSAYDVNPYRGSESGMGWNFILQAARRHRVEAVTRENNRPDIERFVRENGLDPGNPRFHYFDLPRIARFWKRGPWGASAYFYLWQLFLPFFVRRRRIAFDLAHNLNFHTDWVPSFLWLLGKPLVWGPVGHHPPIPAEFLRPYGVRAYLADRARWAVKRLFWACDPWLRACARKAKAVLVMNSRVSGVLDLDPQSVVRFPSVGTEDPGQAAPPPEEPFTVLSVGRFVPLKGFDVAIRAFARAAGALGPSERERFRLVLVGRGPAEPLLRRLAAGLGVERRVEFVPWVKRSLLPDFYRRASVFLFPSHEGAGMVVAEALSHGRPVLCFDNAGPGELVDDSAGLRVPYAGYDRAVEAFAAHLVRLYRSPDLRCRMSEAARRRFEEAFDWRVKGARLDEIYRSVMEPCARWSACIS
ncbi:MAG TPA: glycosyltransferase family 4 protein [Planctomycetota bacterium]|nr:glycosyltransferase family 4 protein [Planctomycetota bacterium]